MSEKRRYPRTNFNAQVKIMHPSITDAILNMRDLSHGGVFLHTGELTPPPVGTVLKLQIQGMADDPPIIDACIVRIEGDGVGLKFLESEES
jgi:hypothetical protein